MFTNYFMLACFCFPFLTFIFYNQFHEILVLWIPDADYYIMKLVWLNIQLYKYCERQNYIFIDYLRNMLSYTRDTKVMLVSKDGEVYTTSVERMESADHNNIDYDYEMILVQFEVKDRASNKHKYDVVRRNSTDKVGDSFKLSKTRFLGTKLNIKEDNIIVKSLEIDFYSNNFYVVENILFDRLFINYWLKQNHNFIMSDVQCYEIIFFDNEIKEHTINEPDYIKLKKDTFEIVKPTIVS